VLRCAQNPQNSNRIECHFSFSFALIAGREPRWRYSATNREKLHSKEIAALSLVRNVGVIGQQGNEMFA
jgi:hypothetical protein